MNLAIAEDNPFALKAILVKLRDYPDVKIKAQALNGVALLSALEQVNIDVVLMDIEMPLMDGIEATRILKSKNPKIKVIALTTFDDDDKILEMIRAGANGYMLKEESKESLYKALYETLEGGASMSPSIAFKVLNLVRLPLIAKANTAVDFQLTSREIEVLEQLKNGLSYTDIGENLFISYGTVRKHIENIYRKLNVDNKVKAINIALAHRIIN